MRAVALWSESDLQMRVLDEAMNRRLDSLADSDPGSDPAAYLLFIDACCSLYGSIAGRWPIYAGSTANARSRQRDHVASLSMGAGVDPDEFAVVWLPQPATATATYAEALLIDIVQPVWNHPAVSGFGSRAWGKARTTQRPSSWDILHPGRREVPSSPKVRTRRRAIKQRIAAHLRVTVPDWQWPIMDVRL